MIVVQEAPFKPGQEIDTFLSTNSNSGGVATFIGQVRNFQTNKDGTKVSVGELELEHYPGMTEKELQRIVDDSRRRWPLDDVHVIHRYGVMKPGDPIVLVCTAAAHRGDAFSACEFIMDWLKTDAPFWKREQTDSGASWVDARDSDSERAARWSEVD